MNISFDNSYMSMEVVGDVESDAIAITGRVKNPNAYNKIQLIAANPIDRMTNYSGSGLPFPCASIAFENTPNKADIKTPTGEFQVFFRYPNSYNSLDAMEKIAPSLFAVFYTEEEPTYVRFQLPERAPLQVRTLVHRPLRTDPTFYSQKEHIIGIRGAEETMRRWADVKLFNGLA